MKIKSLLFVFAVSVFTLAACSEKDNTGKKVKPEVRIEIGNVTENSVDVSIDAPESIDTYYLNLPKSSGVPTAAEIMEDGQRLETNIFTLSHLESASEYIFAVAAVYSDGDVTVADTVFSTLEEKYVQMADGFMAYDGFDSSSGRFRLTIMLSTRNMGDESSDGYVDIMLPVYLKYELDKLDNYTRAVPFGKILPFYTDGTATADMLYYIGKSFIDEDGIENASGFSAFVYENGKLVSTTAADDTDRSEAEIIDNGNGSYTVKGTIADTRGREYKFKFTDTKMVFSIDQAEEY